MKTQHIIVLWVKYVWYECVSFKTKNEKCVEKNPKLLTLVYLISSIQVNLVQILYISVDSLYLYITILW